MSMQPDTRGHRWVYRLIISGFVMVILVGVGGYLAYRKHASSKPTIDPNIRSAISFAALWPAKSAQLTVGTSTIKYSKADKLFSYVATTNEGITLTISEESTPESFIDAPNSYEKLLAGMQKYRSFESQVGTVYLTRPPQLGGGQSAVMNSKGTLLFVRPSRDLSDEAWMKIFNNLQLL